MNELIKVTKPRSYVLQLSLNRPSQLNALSAELLDSLSTLIAEAKRDASVKSVLITGEGKGFCAGADINQLRSLKGQTGLVFAQKGQEIFNQLEKLGKPSLAAIHGFAFGGGCELSMAATFRFMADDAYVGQPEIKLGVIPGFGGTQRLSRLIGKGRAQYYCLTGKRVSAENALKFGFANEVVPADQLLSHSLNFLEELVSQPPLAMKNIISAIDEGYNLSLEDALKLEAMYFGLCCTTEDKQEGVNAFLEKRSAVFSGE